VDTDFSPEHSLAIRERPDGTVFVQDLTVVPVAGPQELYRLLDQGMARRATFETAMNERSSRSHSIFTISLVIKDPAAHTGDVLCGSITLLDLAGSERVKRSRSEGQRFKEAASINKSLSALGNVVSALGDKRTKHIPFRDSKLTRLLQNSLGGNSYTTMLCTATPTLDNYEETLATVDFANRCRNLENVPTVNLINVSSESQETTIKRLQQELTLLKARLSEAETVKSTALAQAAEAGRRAASSAGVASSGAAWAGRPSGTGIGFSATSDEDLLRLYEMSQESNRFLKEKLALRKEEFHQVQQKSRAQHAAQRASLEESQLKIIALLNEVRTGKAELAGQVNAEHARHTAELEAVVAHNQALLDDYHALLAHVPTAAAESAAAATNADALRAQIAAQYEDRLRADRARAAADRDAVLAAAEERHEAVLARHKAQTLEFVAQFQDYKSGRDSDVTRLIQAVRWFRNVSSDALALLADAQEGKLAHRQLQSGRVCIIFPDERRPRDPPPGPVQATLRDLVTPAGALSATASAGKPRPGSAVAPYLGPAASARSRPGTAFRDTFGGYSSVPVAAAAVAVSPPDVPTRRSPLSRRLALSADQEQGNRPCAASGFRPGSFNAPVPPRPATGLATVHTADEPMAGDLPPSAWDRRLDSHTPLLPPTAGPRGGHSADGSLYDLFPADEDSFDEPADPQAPTGADVNVEVDMLKAQLKSEREARRRLSIAHQSQVRLLSASSTCSPSVSRPGTATGFGIPRAVSMVSSRPAGLPALGAFDSQTGPSAPAPPAPLSARTHKEQLVEAQRSTRAPGGSMVSRWDTRAAGPAGPNAPLVRKPLPMFRESGVGSGRRPSYSMLPPSSVEPRAGGRDAAEREAAAVSFTRAGRL
jgi:kinesin family protein 3/17